MRATYRYQHWLIAEQGVLESLECMLRAPTAPRSTALYHLPPGPQFV
jgi:hypothetical protein